jgi:hypothetical protein
MSKPPMTHLDAALGAQGAVLIHGPVPIADAMGAIRQRHPKARTLDLRRDSADDDPASREAPLDVDPVIVLISAAPPESVLDLLRHIDRRNRAAFVFTPARTLDPQLSRLFSRTIPGELLFAPLFGGPTRGR